MDFCWSGHRWWRWAVLYLLVEESGQGPSGGGQLPFPPQLFLWWQGGLKGRKHILQVSGMDHTQWRRKRRDVVMKE